MKEIENQSGRKKNDLFDQQRKEMGFITAKIGWYLTDECLD